MRNKKMSKIFVALLVVVSVLGLAACGSKTTVEKDENGKIVVQGVTKDTVVVGNTASVTGAYNSIGIPFKQMIEAVFDEYNRGGLTVEGHKGLINGRKVEFISIDDKSTADGGIAGYEQLVEDKEIFALVGHFGTWTVAPTVDRIRELGIPMLHAATGTNQLYFENTVGNPVMAIQPIYKTDGRVMTARAVASKLYGAGKNEALANGSTIFVAYSNDDAGKSILAGVEAQIEAFADKGFKVVKEIISADEAATAAGKAEGADVIIVAANQAPFKKFVSDLHDSGKNTKAPIFTSYVNADASHIKKSENGVGDIYMNGWYDSVEAEYTEYNRIIDASTKLTAAEKAELKNSTHAKSGYIAATTFLIGLKRVGTEKLTWASYIAAMESKEIDLLLAGGVDYRNGQRIGTDTMSLWIYNRETEAIEVTDGLKSIPQIIG